ncbi:unnamed protein product [Ceutorhynchus assimilis]|uniref:Lipase n=1 Tax=Ceutorhynchus assimilis TaxID=467358 RepID=A0A9N9MAX4_9CUCU|nr:unnamed protein product [Ceutorhynchus assimilis]
MFWYSVAIIWASWYADCVSCLLHANNVCRQLRDYSTIETNTNCSYNPDVGSTPRLIAKRYGYPFENHEVTTHDGYILNLHRVPGPRNTISKNGKKRTPIFIVHGLAANSAFSFMQGKKSIAFYLADSGFDVWSGNLRGNTYANKHINGTVSNAEYWDFGIEDIALNDLPASIDYIACQIGEKGNLIYIGHSMGTTVSYIYSTLMRKHAGENLKAIISMAPVAYMTNTQGLFKTLAPSTELLTGILKSNGIYYIGQFPFTFPVISDLCGKYPFINLCNLVTILAGGYSESQFQAEILPVFWSFYPSPISLGILQHFSQFSGGRFARRDYGPSGNMDRYGSDIPPEYDVSQIPVPVHLFVGQYDAIATLKDAEHLESKINSGSAVAKAKLYMFPYDHNNFYTAKISKPLFKTIVQIART